MTTFTIDPENNITALPVGEQLEIAGAGVQTFTSQKELAQLAADWPVARLVNTWNGFAGAVPFDQLKPVKKFTDRNRAVNRIWQAIQKLAPAHEEATGQPQDADSAPAAEATTNFANPKQKTPKAPKTANQAKASSKTKSAKPKRGKISSAEAREGSKKAEVVAMLQRKNGATISEIMEKMGWQKHTVRGFMAGAMKKAGYTVESFKSDKGERTYRING
jgi:Protein of unknown function (DUF3489)